jgi:hypothetical protein
MPTHLPFSLFLEGSPILGCCFFHCSNGSNSNLGVVLFFSASTHNNQADIIMYQKPNADADRYDSAPSPAMILHRFCFLSSAIYLVYLVYGNGMEMQDSECINLVYLFYWNGMQDSECIG